MYSTIEGFDAQSAKNAVDGATTYYDATLEYFNAIEGYTPVNY